MSTKPRKRRARKPRKDFNQPPAEGGRRSARLKINPDRYTYTGTTSKARHALKPSKDVAEESDNRKSSDVEDESDDKSYTISVEGEVINNQPEGSKGPFGYMSNEDVAPHLKYDPKLKPKKYLTQADNLADGKLFLAAEP